MCSLHQNQKGVGMGRLIVLLCVVVGLCTGCATVETVTPPSFSLNPDSDFPLIQQDAMQNVRFAAKGGIGKATQDNVTVEVSDIVSQSSANDYSFTFKDSEQEYNFSVFPMLLVLKITNNTDHIVTLNNTIIKIEDDKQNDYPMVNSVVEAKQKALSTIRDMYDARDRKYRETFLADAKDKLNNIYKPQYDRFAQELRTKVAAGTVIRFPETKPGYQIADINKSLIDYSPAEVYKRLQKNLEERQPFTAIKALNMKWIAQQIEKIMPNNMKGIITSGVYQPINILPGRSEKVLVPFSKRREDEIIKKVNIGVYDGCESYLCHQFRLPPCIPRSPPIYYSTSCIEGL